MAWPLFPDEVTGTGGTWSGQDLNSASKLNTAWDDVAISASAVTLPGDGGYRLTYSGATNLDNINGTDIGDKGFLIADHTTGGANLTIRHNGGGTGNIRLPGNANAIVNSDNKVLFFTHLPTDVILVVPMG